MNKKYIVYVKKGGNNDDKLEKIRHQIFYKIHEEREQLLDKSLDRIICCYNDMLYIQTYKSGQLSEKQNTFLKHIIDGFKIFKNGMIKLIGDAQTKLECTRNKFKNVADLTDDNVTKYINQYVTVDMKVQEESLDLYIAFYNTFCNKIYNENGIFYTLPSVRTDCRTCHICANKEPDNEKCIVECKSGDGSDDAYIQNVLANIFLKFNLFNGEMIKLIKEYMGESSEILKELNKQHIIILKKTDDINKITKNRDKYNDLSIVKFTIQQWKDISRQQWKDILRPKKEIDVSKIEECYNKSSGNKEIEAIEYINKCINHMHYITYGKKLEEPKKLKDYQNKLNELWKLTHKTELFNSKSPKLFDLKIQIDYSK